MKNFILGFLILLFSIETYCQDLNLTKQKVNSFSDLEKGLGYQAKDQIIEKLRVSNNTRTSGNVVQLLGNKQQALSENETYIHSDNGNVYTIKYTDEESATINRYTNGQVIQEKKVITRGNFYTLSGDGTILHIDEGHGGASTYTFYSSNLDITGEYKPYPYGVQETDFDNDGSLVAVVSKERVKSPKAKISVLDISGQLISEEEIDALGFTISDIKITDHNIVVLFTKLGGIGSRVEYYNNNLSLQWDESFATGVSQYQIVASKGTGSIVLNTTDKIRCFSRAGEILWDIEPEAVLGENSQKKLALSGSYVFGDRYVGIAIGNVNEAFEITNNKINLLDIETGKVVYTDEVGSTERAIDILPGDSSFYVLSSEKVVKYSK